MHKAATLADSTPIAAPLPLRVEPKPKSGIRQQDLLKNIVEIRPKRHRVSSPSDRSSSRAPVNQEAKPDPVKERSPALPGKGEVESKPESPVKSLLDGLCKVKRVAAAQELFVELQTQRPGRDVYTYNVLLDGIFTNGSYEEAMRLFEKMDNEGLEADIDLFTEMVDKGPTPNNVTYNIMIRGFFQNNEIDKAVQLLYDMVDRDFTLDATNTSSVEDLLAADGLEGKFIGLVDKFLPKRQSKGTVTTVELDV
ncbi:hypothetical protein GIB67_003593 [Kingdonia uniflora]|uniref:Pentatricopeptide repeat-containing protein n=1 Tax=Kingdonia uniflora TaxID=39325 RepID=A0A7J7MES3_9MAGN|nr:hypothetical protein GIB67_003593 [Kingdonia uniflora]